MCNDNKICHREVDHKFEFYDIEDKGDEIYKIYECVCGIRRIEVYTLSKEYEEHKNS
jgi:hypothetical protein